MDIYGKMDQSSQVAVIGSGYWGKNLVRNYARLGALRMICDKNEILLNNFKEQYPGTDTCFAINEVLHRDDIQGVIIATPAETHFTLVREALLAGKHVFVEKPLVLNERDAEEIIILAEKNKLILMVGHLIQYHPGFIRLKELAAAGDLGRINYIYSHRLNLGKIRREENILWSFAPHDISMILSLAGEEPENVMTIGGNYLHKKIADVTTTHLAFPSGLQAHIFVSWLHPVKEQKLVVVGDRKMAVFDDTLPWEDKLLLYAHAINWQNNIPIPTRAESERVPIAQEEPLYRECEHFLQCLQTGRTPTTDGREGLRVLRVLNASQQSMDASGCRMPLRETGRYPTSKVPQDGRDTAGSSPAETSPETPYFVHPSTVIDNHVSIGEGTKIWHFSHILSHSRIGEHCNIGQNVVIGPDVTIGKSCKIQNNVSIYAGVTLEDGVFCGPSMVFTNVHNPRAEIKKMDEARPTLVKRGATIGANATIVCGVTIGRYAFVGAGAVVTKDVADYELVAGNPAKQIGWVCHCGEKLNNLLVCVTCSRKYQYIDNKMEEIN